MDLVVAGEVALGCQRSRFSLPEGRRYLNCAYMAPLSRSVQAAGRVAIERAANPTTIEAPDFFSGPNEIRDLFARVIGLDDPGRVSVIPAASYAFATVARNTRLGPGQNVVTLHDQFPASANIWRRLCQDTGAGSRVVAPPVEGPERSARWNDAILAAIDRDTAVVSVEMVHWTDGTPFDLARIGDRAREVGAAFVVDGTQAVGALPFDLRRVRPDALVCAGYKWLTGPYSLGVAYYGPRYDGGVPLEETWGARAGSEDFAGLVRQPETYRPGAARYDVGEAAGFVLVPMLAAALRQILDWGVPAIAGYLRGLREPIFADGRLEAVAVEADPAHAAHLFGLRLPTDTDPRRTQARLAGRGVHVSVRGRVLRVSPHVYNDGEDIEALIEGIETGSR